MSDLFTDLLKKNQKLADKNKIEAFKWFNDLTTKKINVAKRLNQLAKTNRSRTKPIEGRMFFFEYDPKFKETLPYYDRYPLIFPIDVGTDSMLAINLHYLPYSERAKLMDALYKFANNDKLDVTTKLRLSYEVLQRTKKMRAFQPCLKRYLYSHMKSQLVEIYAPEYRIALFLPLSDFVGASEAKVWSESVKQYR